MDNIHQFDIAIDNSTLHLLTAACGDAKDKASAQRLLQRLKGGHYLPTAKIDVVDCVQLCKALVSGGRSLHRGIEVLELMTKGWAIKPNAKLCSILIFGCTEANAFTQGKRVHAIITKNEVVIDPPLWKALALMYIKSGVLDSQAMSVFDDWRAKASNQPGSISVWNAMLGALAKKGNKQKALAMLDDMKASGVLPDRMTLLVALPICGDLGLHSKGVELHSYLIERDIPVDDYLAAALISMYSKCGKLEKAMTLFNELRARDSTSTPIGVNCWTAIISANAQCGHGKEALALFDEMLDAKIPPNHVTFLACASACGEVRSLERGRELHSRITESGIPINDFLGAALISMYDKCGDLDSAMTRFQELQEKGTSTWNAIIGAHARHPTKTAHALKLFDDMKASGIRPDAVTFSAALSACCKGDEALKRGKEIHAQIIKSRIPLDDFITSALITMYSQCDALDHASATFSKYASAQKKKSGPPPGVSAWTAIIAAHAKEGKSKKALSLFVIAAARPTRVKERPLTQTGGWHNSLFQQFRKGTHLRSVRSHHFTTSTDDGKKNTR